ncbi:gliding motility-associated C-terminal domain-containing protein [Mucilaginibacter lacusdianchii]|uniref:Ig-like domain-containing protein n=1 Tax=Mucilaginibacter lacusdianchii TaxID=2684211 RepID=UPI00131AFB1D|nr:gliding motility-associated C-terminal domain-containing protein [Mucilaginibacter sp. JXJ CY 39]
MYKKLVPCLLLLFAYWGSPLPALSNTVKVNVQRKRVGYYTLQHSVLSHYKPSFLSNLNNLLFTTPTRLSIAAQPITICSGASILIQGDAQTIPPDSYSWEMLQGNTWVNAPGINTNADYQPSLLINNTSTDVIYNIRRKITNGAVSGYDSYYDVTVQASSPIFNNVLTPPAVNSFCSTGTATTITGSTPTGGSGNYSYQWQSSTDNAMFNNITGATNRDFAVPALSTTTYYRRVVTAGSCVTPAPSNAVAIVIQSALANNTLTAPAITTFCLSGDPDAITGSPPTGGSGNYSYQWQISTDNTNFTNIAGASTESYDPPVISTNTYYRRMVTSGSCTTPLISNAIMFTVLNTIANNSINAPATTTFCVNGDAAVLIGNTPTGGNNTYAYQWQRSTNNSTFTDIASATAKDYDPPVAAVTTYYRRTVTSGQCSIPLVSNVVTITISALTATPVPTQSAVSVCSGNAATLSVQAQTGLTYNWYDSPARTTLLYTGSTYVTSPITASRVFYVESSNGTCSSTVTAAIQVNITPPPSAPAVLTNEATTCSSTSAVLTVSNPQTGLIYTWYGSATGGPALGTGITFNTPALTSNTTYYVEAANAGGCTSAARTSVNVTVVPLPQVTVQGTLICPGNSATLQATANIPNATINWYAAATGGSPLATGATFTTSALNAVKIYYIEVINNATSCVSTSRQTVQVQLIQPLATPFVSVAATTSNSITFKWDVISGATGYLVSINNGQTYTDPSSGSNGLTHTITGLTENQTATILVRALGTTACEQSNSGSATAQAISQTDEIYIANAFTPNGDGKNDIIQVHSPSIKSMTFYVYSQWGELLFTSTNPNTGWDGSYKGIKEPVGVYIYYLKAVMNNGHEVNKKGTITLLR